MRSTNRGPTSGVRPDRLRWSETSTGCPTESPSRNPPAALVSTTTFGAGGAGGADVVHDHVEVVALVGVDAAEEGEHAAAADVDRADLAAVADRRAGRGSRRGRRASNVGRRSPEQVGRGQPSRAEDDRDVVPRRAGQLGEASGGRPAASGGFSRGGAAHESILARSAPSTARRRARSARHGRSSR